MCDTASIVLGTLSALGSGAQLLGQQETANAAQKAHNAALEATAKSANKAAVEGYYAADQRLIQEREAASEKLQDVQRQRLEATGTAMASSQGSTLGRLLDDFYRQEGRYKENVRQNFDMTALQIGQQKKSIQAQAEDRISVATPFVAPQVDYAGAGLQIVGAGVKGYAHYKYNQGDKSWDFRRW